MITTLTIIIALNCVLLMFVVLIQNPKGGGIDSTFGGSGANQMLGAAKSTKQSCLAAILNADMSHCRMWAYQQRYTRESTNRIRRVFDVPFCITAGCSPTSRCQECWTFGDSMRRGEAEPLEITWLDRQMINMARTLRVLAPHCAHATTQGRAGLNVALAPARPLHPVLSRSSRSVRQRCGAAALSPLRFERTVL